MRHGLAFALCLLGSTLWAHAAGIDGAVAPGREHSSGKDKALDQITVEARRTHEQHLNHVVVPRFIASHAIAEPKSEQVARWQDALCVTTVGLDPEYNTAVSRRVAEVAEAVGVPKNTAEKCRPNVEIHFNTSPQREVDYIVKDANYLLGYHYTHQLQALAAFTRPVQAWYVTATVDDDGFALVDAPEGALRSPDDGRRAESYQVYGSHLLSRLYSGRSSKFVNVLIIVDAAKIGDYPLRSIADYAAALALTHAGSLDGCSELPSILDLLSSGCGVRAQPRAITAADTAFLRALYSSHLRMFANLQRGEIHDHMLQDIVAN
jgi:hypothetical protein